MCASASGSARRTTGSSVPARNHSCRGGSAILPTPAIGGVGLMADYDKSASIAFKAEGEDIYLIGHPNGHLGQSLWLREIKGREDGAPPSTDLDLERKAGDNGIVQAIFDLGRSDAPAGIEALNTRGYSFGGFMPCWFETDALMLQRLTAEPNFEAINLYTDRAKAILAHIRQEWETRGR